MPCITLPDGSKKNFDHQISILQIAKSISPSLAKATIAGKLNNELLVDSSYIIADDCNVKIITASEQSGLDIIRHSTAHLLAHAVKNLFPTAQVTIGPVIENGFFYDFAFDKTFTSEDLIAIEKQMHKIASENHQIHRKTLIRDQAIEYFNNIGEIYKAKIIEDIPANEVLSLYSQGDFTDLCRGPHVPSTGYLKAFKLTKVAGAYWRGDAKNQVLQRIYGTAWSNKEQLKDYLHRLDEALKRDHRKLGKQLDLFHLQEEATGMVFWHPKGWATYQILIEYMREIWRKNGYQEINTPQIVDRVLWEKSGHWEKFLNGMYTTEIEDRNFAIKPMSCPGHVQVFNNQLRSYRDLPLRLAEFGCCHRKEPSGTLHGLMRVRAFVQDDAHIFCTEEQLEAEATNFNTILFKSYEDFGFTDITLKLSTRPKERVGSDELWDRAEQTLSRVLNNTGKPWEIQPNEGAFYGPKIEYTLKDCIGRSWQLGTLQLDYAMPARLDSYYIDENGNRRVPVMLHRVIFGTLERFFGILIEHYAGKLPVWLAPIQVIIINISDRHIDYAQFVYSKLTNLNFRAKIDFRNEKMGFKIREHTLQKVPFLLIVGDNEVASKTISVRKQDGRDLGSIELDDFIALLKQDIKNLGKII